MDRLSRRAMEAERLGMSYGQYMAALYDGTIHEAPEPEDEAELPTPGKYGLGTCEECGQTFTRTSGGQRYCKGCRAIAQRRKSKEYKRRQREKAEMEGDEC